MIKPGVIWAVLIFAIAAPIALAATSPLLAWRGPIYIAAGFAGILGMALLLVQPLLAGEHLPGFKGQAARRVHRWVGATLVILVIAHVGGLWITSPPDVIDALLFASPTPFSAWGVVAMWAVFLSALVAVMRKGWRIRWRVWRRVHTGLAAVIVIGTVVHALLIDGAMELVSKALFCVVLVGATALVFWGVRRSAKAP